MKALVFASAVGYKRFIVNNKLNPQEYRRIYSVEDIHGYKDQIVLDITPEFMADDWERITDYCESHNIDIMRLF